MIRKNFKELKAILVRKKQEVKRLKKALRQTKEVHKSILIDYHTTVAALQKDLATTQRDLGESRRKKWYQFRQI